MLTNEKFNQWFYNHNFSEQSRKVLEQIRCSEPSAMEEYLKLLSLITAKNFTVPILKLLWLCVNAH